MLKHQDNYKDCTDEEREGIWNTVQCEGYTPISLKMNRYDNQYHNVKVCESKEYIDNILKKYGY